MPAVIAVFPTSGALLIKHILFSILYLLDMIEFFFGFFSASSTSIFRYFSDDVIFFRV
jgi:hypothetical protein